MFDGTTYMKFEQKTQIQSNGEDLSLRFKTQYARGNIINKKILLFFLNNVLVAKLYFRLLILGAISI